MTDEIQDTLKADIDPALIARHQAKNFTFIEETMADQVTANGLDLFLPLHYELGQVLNHLALTHLIQQDGGGNGENPS